MVDLVQITEEEIREGINNIFSNVDTFTDFSHELQTPLASLVSNSYVLQRLFDESYGPIGVYAGNVLKVLSKVKNFEGRVKKRSSPPEFNSSQQIKNELYDSMDGLIEAFEGANKEGIGVHPDVSDKMELIFQEYNGIIGLLKSVGPLRFSPGNEHSIYDLWELAANQVKRMGLAVGSTVFFTYFDGEYHQDFLSILNEGDGAEVLPGYNPFEDTVSLVNFAGYMANFLGNTIKYAKGENEPIMANLTLEEDENYFILHAWDDGNIDPEKIAEHYWEKVGPSEEITPEYLSDPRNMLEVLTSDFSEGGDPSIHGASQGRGLKMIRDEVGIDNMYLRFGEEGTHFTVYIPKN